jgi:hypothetical protein
MLQHGPYFWWVINFVLYFLLCQNILSKISSNVFRDEAQRPPDMTYSLQVYFNACAPFELTGSMERRLRFCRTMKLEYLVQSVQYPRSNGWRCLRCLFSTLCLVHGTISMSRLTWRLELACKNTMRVLNYRVSLSTDINSLSTDINGKMNLSVVLVKFRHQFSFVFDLCRQSSETLELVIISIE